MRRPCGKRVAGRSIVQRAKRVDVARVEHALYRPPADRPAAQPDERAKPIRQLAEIEQIAGRQRVEVAVSTWKPCWCR